MVSVCSEGKKFNDIKCNFYKCYCNVCYVYNVVKFLWFFYVVFNGGYIWLGWVVNDNDVNCGFKCF